MIDGVYKNGFDYISDGVVAVSLWNEDDEEARNADIDILEIREDSSLNYAMAINAVVNELKNDTSRPRKYMNGIPVRIVGHPGINNNSMKLLKKEFKSIHT